MQAKQEEKVWGKATKLTGRVVLVTSPGTSCLSRCHDRGRDRRTIEGGETDVDLSIGVFLAKFVVHA